MSQDKSAPEEMKTADQEELAVELDNQETTEKKLLQPEETSPKTTPMKKDRWAFVKKHKKIFIGLGIAGVLLLTVLTVLSIYTLTVVNQLKSKAQETMITGQSAYGAFKGQNLPEAEVQIKKVQEQVTDLKKTYQKLGFYNFIPIAHGYYQDGLHGFNAAEAGVSAGVKSIAAIAPYADVLGFSGEGTFEGGAAENRIKLMLDTLEKVTPILDEISADLNTAQTELSQINEKRYPVSFRGTHIRSKIVEGKELITGASTALTDYRPIIEKLPEIAGSTDGRKKYLVIFQNDNELRPTGGFMTAYSVIFIEDGVVTPEKSDDIYELDQKFNKRIDIPEALGKYLTTEKYWNLRDMNISPDFKISMDQFFSHYKDVRGEPADIDGIIAVDTHVLSGIMKITGPVEVPGYGTFSAENDARCDCPQVVYALSEIITRPTPYHRADRKGIIGPMMKSLLTKIYSSPRVYLADLFKLGLESLEGRHLQAYLFKEDHQQAVEAINAAGRLTNDEAAPDFFALVNANLGGAKSNLFVSYDMTQVVSAPENGELTKEVTITYKNDRKADNCNLEAGLLCLNSTLRDWTRVYLPQGAKLVKAEGFTQEIKEYDEAGFHVIDGFFTLEPLSQAKLKLTYTVPYTDVTTYKVKLWKQGGIDSVLTIMDVNGGQEEVLLNKDTVYEVDF